MARPSMFSSSYEKQMKRRRINIILTILLIISVAFFGGKYYLNKNKSVKNNISSIFTNLYNKVGSFNFKKDKKDNVKDVNKSAAAKEKQTNNKAVIPTLKPAVVNTIKFYAYKSSDGKIYKVQYTEKNNTKVITGLLDTSKTSCFDISTDKKRIVFDNTATGEIMLGDTEGKVVVMNKDYYKSKKSGRTSHRDKVLKAFPGFIWAAKPHFTQDNRIVFVSNLPFIEDDAPFYLWSVSLDAGKQSRIGDLNANKLDDITYEGFTPDKSLKIKTPDKTCYLNTGSDSLN